MHLILTVILTVMTVNPAYSQSEAKTAEKNHDVIAGDTLWDIADYYYGDPFKWPAIYKANSSHIKDPHWIYPNQLLLIPGIMEAAAPAAAEAPAQEAAPAARAEAAPVEAAAPEAEQVETGMPQGPLDIDSSSARGTETPAPGPAGNAGVQAEAAYSQRQPGTSDIAPENMEKMGIINNMTPPMLADQMPPDIMGGYPSMHTYLALPDWKEDGRVSATSADEEFDAMAEQGEVVKVRLNAGLTAQPGQILTIFRKGMAVKDKQGRVLGVEVQKSAVLKVTEADGEKLEAEIVKLYNPVELNDLVKIGSAD